MSSSSSSNNRASDKLPEQFEAVWNQASRSTRQLRSRVADSTKEVRTKLANSTQQIQTDVQTRYRLMSLTLQETWEDLKAADMEQKRSIVITFTYKNRLVFLAALFLVSSVLSLMHDMHTTAFYMDNHGMKRPFGSTDVVRLSINHVEPPSDVTAAVCFKTLFGDIDLGVVIQWAAYNRLMGFDQIFMFYRPEVISHPRFEELDSLPYVTLTVNKRGKRKDYFEQWRTERHCLNRDEYAAGYDWVLLADVDEYLWFPEEMGVKTFLQRHDNMTYLSLGKKMHSLDHRTDHAALDHKIDTTQDGFAVSKYPFYMNHYCNHDTRKGDPMCPTWRGRAKVMVRPQHHFKVEVHGNIYHPKPANGTIHLHPDEAHFMEWPDIFDRHNVTLRYPKNFTIQAKEEVHIHDVKKAFKPVDTAGNYLVEYDNHLEDWFDFVVSRASQK